MIKITFEQLLAASWCQIINNKIPDWTKLAWLDASFALFEIVIQMLLYKHIKNETS